MATAPQTMTVQDAQLTAKWSTYLEENAKDATLQAALQFPEVKSVSISFTDLQVRDPDLANYLLQKPAHALRTGVNALNQIDVTVTPRPKLHLRILDLPESSRITVRALRAEHLGHMVSVTGTIKKVTEVRPTVLHAVFECKVCTSRASVLQEDEFLVEPPLCETCDAQRPWRLLEEESKFLDHQKVDIQESMDAIPAGAQPERITVHMQDDLVHQVLPGEAITINGILTTQPRRQGKEKRVEFNKVLLAVSVQHIDPNNIDSDITPEELASFEAATKDPGHLEKMRGSVASTLYGLEYEKLAGLAAVFGGVDKPQQHARGMIHVLFVGDPSTGKSQILKALSRISPRGIFTSGKGASAAGLTAAAVRDETDGRWTLEAGALVLADKGIACVDEMDKMEEGDQSALHQAMEHGEVSKDTAGIHATLMARTGIIGAANPKKGRFDAYENIWDQIGFPPALGSRFDLIFAILEKPNDARDRATARTIMLKHGVQPPADAAPVVHSITPPYEEKWIRRFVKHARTVRPELTWEAAQRIEEYYVNLRKTGGETVPISARQMEGLIRMGEAFARMRLSPTVALEDVERGIILHEEFMKRVGVDPGTGLMDADKVALGVSHNQQKRMDDVMEILRTLCKEAPHGYAREEDVIRDAMTRGHKMDEITKALEMLSRHGSIYAKNGKGTWAPLR